MAAADNELNMKRMPLVVELMRKVGLNVDMQVSDWGTMMQRVFAARCKRRSRQS